MRTHHQLPSGRTINHVSLDTRARFDSPVTMLAARAAGSRLYTGACFLFSVNPQTFNYSQSARSSVQDTTGGWLVNESGMGAPRFKLAGNFGWRTRKIELPRYTALAKGAVGYLPRLNQDLRQEAVRQEDYSQIKPAGTPGSFELDGFQAWQALRDFITWYSESNVKLVREGQLPLEMVLFDTLHTLRWVVSPVAAPSLEHTADHQGVTPYVLELIGVYDDTRPREAPGLPQLFGGKPNKTEDKPFSSANALMPGASLTPRTPTVPLPYPVTWGQK